MNGIRWWVVYLALAWPAAAWPQDAGSKVVLLGTGTPNADPDRFGPAVAVIVHGTPYLVDAGPGIVRRTAAARRRHSSRSACTMT